MASLDFASSSNRHIKERSWKRGWGWSEGHADTHADTGEVEDVAFFLLFLLTFILFFLLGARRSSFDIRFCLFWLFAFHSFFHVFLSLLRFFSFCRICLSVCRCPPFPSARPPSSSPAPLFKLTLFPTMDSSVYGRDFLSIPSSTRSPLLAAASQHKSATNQQHYMLYIGLPLFTSQLAFSHSVHNTCIASIGYRKRQRSREK